jgi:hypothetical protein
MTNDLICIVHQRCGNIYAPKNPDLYLVEPSVMPTPTEVSGMGDAK